MECRFSHIDLPADVLTQPPFVNPPSLVPIPSPSGHQPGESRLPCTDTSWLGGHAWSLPSSRGPKREPHPSAVIGSLWCIVGTSHCAAWVKYLSFSRITLRGLGKSMSSFVLHYLIHKASLEVKEICSKKKTRKRSCVVRNGNTFFEKSFWALRWAVSNPASKIWPPATCRTGIRAHTHCFVCLLSPLAELLDYRGLPCSGFIG